MDTFDAAMLGKTCCLSVPFELMLLSILGLKCAMSLKNPKIYNRPEDVNNSSHYNTLLIDRQWPVVGYLSHLSFVKELQ